MYYTLQDSNSVLQSGRWRVVVWEPMMKAVEATDCTCKWEMHLLGNFTNAAIAKTRALLTFLRDLDSWDPIFCHTEAAAIFIALRIIDYLSDWLVYHVFSLHGGVCAREYVEYLPVILISSNLFIASFT